MAQTTPNIAGPAAAHAVLKRLANASDASVPCMLAFDATGGRTSRRAQLAEVTDKDLRLLLDRDPEDANVLARLANSDDAASVTVALRFEGDELVFFTRVLRLAPPPPNEPGGGRTIDVTLALPAEVVATRRRSSFRVAVTADDGIALRLWRIDEYAILRDQPPPSRHLKAGLRDLSAGGMRAIVWANRVEALALAEDQRFRVELRSGDTEMLLEARLRHPRSTERDDEYAFCGFEFIHRDTIESRRNRQKLDAMLAKLQRSAARRDAA